MKNLVLAFSSLCLLTTISFAAISVPAPVPTPAPAPETAPPVVMTPQQYVHLGNLAGRQEKYQEALIDYTKAIQTKPDFSNAYYNRGYVYLELRKYKLALADLDKAIELDPEYASAYHVRGIVYFLKKKYAQAVANYSTAIELNPKSIKFYTSRLSAYCKMGNSDKAWEDVIHIQQLGGVVNPLTVNLLKNKKYRE